MWRPSASQIQLMERRDRIQVIPIQVEDQYEAAFAQVQKELEKIRAGGVPIVATTADTFAYDRTQYARAVELRYGTAVLSGLYPPSERHRPDDVELSKIFVEPNLELQERRWRGWDSVENFDRVVDVDRDIEDTEDEEISLSEARRRESAERPESSRKAVAEVLLASRTVVLLGAPGSGNPACCAI